MPDSTKHKELLRLLYTDELTHIYNRRYLRERIPAYFVQAATKRMMVAFLMFDMDNFKGINDSYGHQIGDKALVHFARTIVGVVQKSGIPIRYAGDEFCLIVPDKTKQQAIHIGEMIHQKLTAEPLKVDAGEITLGCSIGVSLFPTNGNTWEDLFKKADEALYMAKKQGKGRIVAFPDSGKLLTPEKLDSILANPDIVGRNEILEYMEKYFTGQGDPAEFPVLLGGDGTGKSRLIEHGHKLAKENLKFALFAKGYPFWQTEMYGAVFAALGTLFEQQQNISNMVFEKLDKKYKAILKPHLYPWDSKEIAEGEEGKKEYDNVAIFEALTQTLYIICEIGDGAILLDDAERIDSPSLQFFDSLFNQKEGGKIFFISSINQPDLSAGEENMLGLLSSMREVSASAKIKKFILKPLKDDDVRQLVRNIFDGKALPPETEKALLENTGGNPLFIVETLSYLLQESKISTSGDAWELSAVSSGDIPLKLEDLITSRLMQMDEEAVNVLKLASVMGERIRPKQLAEMSGLKVQQVLDILGNARRALLIEETPNPEEFIFAHRMDRSVFYSLMSDDERHHYHTLAAEIEQKFGAGSLERIVGRLAYHYQNAGQLETAAKMFSTMKDQMNSVLISEGTRKALQKRIITASMAKESPLDEQDLGNAIEVARAFKVAMQNLRLYPKENENVKKSLDKFLELLNMFLSEKTEALSISLTSETLLFNGQPPPPDKADLRLTTDMYAILNSYGLQGVLFLRGITVDEIVEFLDIFIRRPEEVAGKWDAIVEEKEFSHVMPDRKMFVAVGERRIVLDEKEVLAQTAGNTNSSVEASDNTTQVTDDQIERLRSIAEQFTKDKTELLHAITGGNVSGQEIQRLIDILEHSDVNSIVGNTVVQVPVDSEADSSAEESTSQPVSERDRYADVLPDVELVKQVDSDFATVFDDLNSPDTNTRAKAAAWLVGQDHAKLGAAAFRVITSEQPLKTRRLAAAIVKKAGKDAVDVLLSNVHPGMSAKAIKKFIDVCMIFADNPKLITITHELILSGPPDVIHPTFDILKQLPGKSVNPVLLDIFDRAAEKTRIEVLGLFTERKIVEAVPVLLELLKLKKIWEKDDSVQLQAQVCKTLGYLKSSEATEVLIGVAIVSKPWALLKTKPDLVRAAAAWALRQLPVNEKTKNALETLKKDKSALVRKAAG